MAGSRRRMLRALGAATLGSLAGCTGDGSLLPKGLPGSAAAPEWHDPTRTAKLVPDDGDAQDEFGVSVSLSRDRTTALAGARYDEDPNGELAGSAYVFSRTDGKWRQQARLVPDDGDEGDLFGFSVALAGDGTTALIGAIGDEGPKGRQAGSAYVFAQLDGFWSQQAKLVPDGVDWLDSFGESVALSRDATTALVGAPGDEDSNGDRTGSAYVFSRGDGEWRRRTRLTADDSDSRDDFGSSTAISADGSTALVGAPSDENSNGDRYAGSVHGFSRVDGSWRQQTKLVPDDGDSRDLFGDSVALAGDGATAIVGASTDEDPNGRKAGSAYVFSGADRAWSQVAKIAPKDGDEGDSFGVSVDLAADGWTTLVGCYRDEAGHGEDAGSAYVYHT